MLVRLMENQINTYTEVINATIDASMPHYEEESRTNLFKELLLGLSQAWIYYNKDEKFEGVLITQIRNDLALGKKTFTLLCIHAPEGTENESFIEGWPKLKEFGLAQGCTVFDFYTDNEEAIKYARLFPIIHETRYFQIDMTED